MQNKNIKRRLELFKDCEVQPMWGDESDPFFYFKGLTADTLQTLIDEGFADPEDTQNNSPSTQEFLDFMRKHPTLTAHGYAVDMGRDDSRVSVEGLAGTVSGPEELKEFKKFCKGADELNVKENEVRSWWD